MTLLIRALAHSLSGMWRRRLHTRFTRVLTAAPLGALVGVLTIGAAPASASGQVVASTFGPDDSFNRVVGGAVFQERFLAQSFVYTGSSGFELFQIRLGLFRAGADISVQFLSGAAISTAALLESWSLPSSFSRGAEIATFTSMMGNVLQTGATYWVAVSSTTPRTEGAVLWMHNDQGFSGRWRALPPEGWVYEDFISLAYDVSARPTAVPEPETGALLLASILILGYVGARRRRSIET